MVSVEVLCRDYYRENRESIRIKKEDVAVKNLVTIVTTTLNLSYKKGFDAMSLRDLSRESKLSMGALYSYFNSKEELLSLIQYHGQAAVEKILREYVGRGNNPLKKLQNAIRIHLYLSELMQRWFYFFFMEAKNLNKKYKKLSVESELMTERIITDIIEDGVTQKIFTVDDVRLAGSVIKAMMQDWYLKQWKYRERKVSVESYAQCIIDIAESYLTNKRSHSRTNKK
ncbi:MAG: TetR/AcrR family transcriptional regulator [Spirochaetes bacterium]|nr:TetR/AcrR family transcriptional regulator [Spirochaetota bacterium]